MAEMPCGLEPVLAELGYVVHLVPWLQKKKRKRLILYI